MIAVTGATGQLGRLVLEVLLTTVPASEVVAMVRQPEKAKLLAERGVQVRFAEYSQPESLRSALSGVQKVLLVSSSELGRRMAQHKAVVDAAQEAGVQLLAYTSILHADSSALLLAGEHKETEAYIRSTGIPFSFLRNGWYTENYLAGMPAALEHGTLLGAANGGRVASAARRDYAAAAAAVLMGEGHEDSVYELAGDTAYTLAELAGEISRQANRPVVYKNLSPEAYAAALTSHGLPEAIAAAIADADAQAAHGALDIVASQDLRRLIGRPTTPMPTSVADALQG